jgi:hypothetical protein
MDGYAEPPSREEVPSGCVDAYASADDDQTKSEGELQEARDKGYAIHEGAAPSQEKSNPKSSHTEKKSKSNKTRNSTKKSKKAKEERDFELNEEVLQSEREEQERLAKFDPYGASSGAGTYPEESFLPFFSAAASPTRGGAYAANHVDAYAEASGQADPATPSVYATGNLSSYYYYYY